MLYKFWQYLNFIIPFFGFTYWLYDLLHIIINISFSLLCLFTVKDQLLQRNQQIQAKYFVSENIR